MFLVLRLDRRLHQAEFEQPGMLAGWRGWPGPRSGTGGEEEGGQQGNNSSAGDYQEQAQPAKPLLDILQLEVRTIFCGPLIFTHIGQDCHQEVVDDVAGEEEGVDEPAVLVAECLRGDGRLGGVCSWEGQVYGPDPESEHNLHISRLERMEVS